LLTSYSARIYISFLPAQFWQNRRLAKTLAKKVRCLLIDPIPHAAFWQERDGLAKFWQRVLYQR
jgi:hypothetical protein